MIELRDVHKTYTLGGSTVRALDSVTLSIGPGEFIAIMGPSGSGKSTLLHVLGLLDVPDHGSYQLLGREVGQLNDDELAVLRRGTIGFIFQQFNLLPRLTALENTAMPLLYSQGRLSFDRARELLAEVGLGERMSHRPNELSGGQQQRVAIARALALDPKLMLFDEVTSALDPELVAGVLEEMRRLADEGMTMIVVTHEMGFAQEVGDRIVFLDEGVIVEEGPAREIITNPKHPETRGFLKSIVH